MLAGVAYPQQQIINTGAAPNSGTGDTLQVWATKDNANFTQLFGVFGSGVAPSAIPNCPSPDALNWTTSSSTWGCTIVPSTSANNTWTGTNTFSAPVQVNSTLGVSGATTLSSTLAVSGVTTLGSTTVGSLTDTGNAGVSGTLTVNGATSLGNLSVSGSAVIPGYLPLTGGAITGATSVTGGLGVDTLTASSTVQTSQLNVTGHITQSGGVANTFASPIDANGDIVATSSVSSGTILSVNDNFSGTGTAAQVVFAAGGNTNGVNLRLTGSGGSKTFRVDSSGDLRIANTAYNTYLFDMTDAGNLGISGSVTAPSFVSTSVMNIGVASNLVEVLTGVGFQVDSGSVLFQGPANTGNVFFFRSENTSTNTQSDMVLSRPSTATGLGDGANFTLQDASTSTGLTLEYGGTVSTFRVGGTVLAQFSSAGVPTFPHVTTGTSADYACFASGGVLILQTSVCVSSMRSLKEAIRPATAAETDSILHLPSEVFRFKATKPANPDPNATALQAGVIADEVAKYVPLCAIYKDDMKTPKSYRPECLTSLLMAQVQKQAREIAKLEARVARLERKHR